mmetsp:Transcript_15386/g.37076  ORF Transcript_15386/g.37076 Transcript_15386/m.37076 type:complete len:279 (+) Transcript_15386:104-940(+)
MVDRQFHLAPVQCRFRPGRRRRRVRPRHPRLRRERGLHQSSGGQRRARVHLRVPRWVHRRRPRRGQHEHRGGVPADRIHGGDLGVGGGELGGGDLRVAGAGCAHVRGRPVHGAVERGGRDWGVRLGGAGAVGVPRLCGGGCGPDRRPPRPVQRPVRSRPYPPLVRHLRRHLLRALPALRAVPNRVRQCGHLLLHYHGRRSVPAVHRGLRSVDSGRRDHVGEGPGADSAPGLRVDVLRLALAWDGGGRVERHGVVDRGAARAGAGGAVEGRAQPRGGEF